MCAIHSIDFCGEIVLLTLKVHIPDDFWEVREEKHSRDRASAVPALISLK
jgi:hypothetical protein